MCVCVCVYLWYDRMGSNLSFVLFGGVAVNGVGVGVGDGDAVIDTVTPFKLVRIRDVIEITSKTSSPFENFTIFLKKPSKFCITFWHCIDET